MMNPTMITAGIFRAHLRPDTETHRASAMLDSMLKVECFEYFFDECDERFSAVLDVILELKFVATRKRTLVKNFHEFECERPREVFADLAIKNSLASPFTEAVLLYYLRLLIEAIHCHWLFTSPQNPEWINVVGQLYEQIIGVNAPKPLKSKRAEAKMKLASNDDIRECAELVMLRVADVACWVIDLLGGDDNENKKLKLRCKLCSDLATKEKTRRKCADSIYNKILLLEEFVAKNTKAKSPSAQTPVRSTDAVWPYQEGGGVNNYYHDCCVEAIKTMALRQWFSMRAFKKAIKANIDPSTIRKWLSLFPERIESNNQSGNKRQYRRMG